SPQTAQELLEHACLLYRRERDGRLMRWPFTRDGQRSDPQQRIATIGNDIDALVEFAAAGGGIVWAGSFIVHDYVRQGRLLPLTLKPGRKGQLQFENAPLDFFACFKDRQYVPAKVRALVDYLLEELQQQAKLS
ncbi:MAG: LysR substrate-binding domain-containing protein, partial [Comamonas sp.]